MPELTPQLERLMDAAWPAAQRDEAGGWVLRAASGVTQRANSVWPREPGEDPEALRRTLAEARRWYRDRRLPLIFQVFEGPGYAPLNAVLDAEGFTRQSETLIMSRPSGNGFPGSGSGRVEVQDAPDEEWLHLWWSVDGRGGEGQRDTARAILTGCPSLYALVRGDDGVPAAVGRLAMVHGTGGIYCMATSASGRRRGYATAVLQALLAEGGAHGVDRFWLLVTAANQAARQLYSKAGFTESGRYIYRQQRPRRALTGC